MMPIGRRVLPGQEKQAHRSLKFFDRDYCVVFIVEQDFDLGDAATEGKRLRAELDAVAHQGYAIDNEEITRGQVCVAAPIYGVDGNVEAAISCTVSSFDADDTYLEKVRDHVIACAEAASG